MAAYHNAFGYIPAGWLAIIAVVFFSISFALLLASSIVYRHPLIVVPIIGTAGELAGWACRVNAHYHPNNYSDFLGQIIALIISPVFYSAEVYVLLYHWVMLYGPRFSLLKPKLYAIIFITFDIIALVLQAAGGGIAGGAKEGSSEQNKGANIMLGGICFQLFSTVVFSILGLMFAAAVCRGKPVRAGPSTTDIPRSRYKDVCFLCLCLATLAILVRAVYRVVELAGGWSGSVITHEVWFGVFDFIPMIIASFFLLPSIYPATQTKNGGFNESASYPTFKGDSSERDEKSLSSSDFNI
ncbi:parasitic phase-specific protein PSP-1 [Schizosaccharomyces octosporus yFS286]|uniref:Parasitic phase-specific protein PSP-1 n=1 Tax=Schizosaccharomyces octosporus (strain yFS286) TaxID=483514 RepID=S9RB54_SCHOY|nr:parasitic phase-specific protein PSP-1 [Schizosaccharomyces octosporus yFS286]EPX75370.1 parasitic phase-specific protein PSP-1 [Schizosaccharomyces octosporus yFS286]